MYKFIKNYQNDYLINECDIVKIEEYWNIKFPFVLKQFYLNYNGVKIYLCEFEVDGFKYEISGIIPLKYGKCCFEEIIRNDRQDGIIPENFVPVAKNRGGDYYYWDELDGKVYMIYCDDIENPICIFGSIQEMFEIMNVSCS